VFDASGELGLNVAVFDGLSYATVAVTLPDGPLSVTVDAVSVELVISRLKPIATNVPVATPVAPGAGALETIVGATPAVVKLQLTVASVVPSWAARPESRTV
jgi:hypothetical protein